MGCKWAPDFESVHQSNFKKKIYEQQASFLWSDFDNAFWIRHLVIIKIRRLLNEPDTKERKQRKLCNPLRLFSQVKIRKRGERAKWAMWGTCEHGRKQEISRERQKRMRTQHREKWECREPFSGEVSRCWARDRGGVPLAVAKEGDGRRWETGN